MGFLNNPNQNIDGSLSKVSSVNGKTGSVSLGASDVGLGNLTNDVQVKRSEMGIANGVALLDINGKLVSAELPDSILGSVNYRGVWNANTNTPTISAASNSNKGYYYVVSVAGSTPIDGVSSWAVGDWIISDGSTWSKITTTQTVSSVAGKTGAVTLTKTDVGLENVQNVDQTNADNLSSGTVNTLRLPVMGASGTNHKAGIVPDTGNVAGTTKYLREDGQWITPAGGIAGSNGQIQFNDNGASGADSNLNWDNTNKRFGIGTSSPEVELHIQSNKTVTPTKVDLRNNFVGQNGSGDDYEISTINLGCQGFNSSISTKIPNGAWGDGCRLDLCTPIGSNDNTQKPRISIMPFSGNVGIGTTTPNTSAILDLSSTEKGFLPPCMTTVQRNAINSPTEGLVVFDTDLKSLMLYFNSKWSINSDVTWKEYIPTIGGTTTAPTFPTAKTLKSIYKVIGKTLYIKFTFSSTSAQTGSNAGNGAYTFSIPSNITIDTTLTGVPSTISGANGNYTPTACLPLGRGASGNNYVTVVALSTTTLGLYVETDGGYYGLIGSILDPINLTANTNYTFTCEVPIV